MTDMGSGSVWIVVLHVAVPVPLVPLLPARLAGRSSRLLPGERSWGLRDRGVLHLCSPV